MANVSPYAPRGGNMALDARDTKDYASEYIAADLRDGRFGVFLVHRNSREWWRLVAIFSTWQRAVKYATVESDCAPSLEEERPKDYAAVWDQERLPAPVTLPPEPPSALRARKEIIASLTADDLRDLSPELLAQLRQPAQAIAAATAGATETPEPQPLPEAAPVSIAPQTTTAAQPDVVPRRCPECGEPIVGKRAANPKTKYCSDACGKVASKKRVAIKTDDPDQVSAEQAEASVSPFSDRFQMLADESAAWFATATSITETPVEAQSEPKAVEAAESESVAADDAARTTDSCATQAAGIPITAPRDLELSEINRFIAEKGVTKVPGFVS